MILVTGAMGCIGTAATAALQRQGHLVRAIVPSRRQVPWLSESVQEFVECNDETMAPPERALAGVTAVILLSRPTADALAAQRRTIEACAHAGISRIVKLSVAGAAPAAVADAARWHWIAEEHVYERAAQPVVLRAGRTMQDLLHQLALMRSHHMLVGCQGNGLAADVDARDIGDVLAALATHEWEPELAYQRLLATGPTALTRNAVAAVVGQAMGMDMRYVPCTPPDLEQFLITSGISRWQVDDLVAYEVAAANGEWQQVNDTVLRYSGHPPRSLSAFATELALTMSFNGEGHRQTAVPSMA
jgi:uncharacterized protein YbjT (DUF2867 family)